MKQRIYIILGIDYSGTWDNPPSQYDLGQAGRVYEIKEKIKKVVNKRNIGNWGWNDPRTCLTLPYFLEQLDGDVHLISVFRKPLLVAKSLKRRNGFSIKRGMKLVVEYNQRLLENIRSFVSL